VAEDRTLHGSCLTARVSTSKSGCNQRTEREREERERERERERGYLTASNVFSSAYDEVFDTIYDVNKPLPRAFRQ
jgi:hypothetical protein